MQHTFPSGAVLLSTDKLPAYERGGGARTTPLVTRELGASSFISGVTSFDPDVSIPFHSHNCQESVTLLEGEAILDIDGAGRQLSLLDTTLIPPDVPHRFRNASATKPMKILWIYASPAATRTLIDSGVTTPVALEHDTSQIAKDAP